MMNFHLSTLLALAIATLFYGAVSESRNVWSEPGSARFQRADVERGLSGISERSSIPFELRSSVSDQCALCPSRRAGSARAQAAPAVRKSPSSPENLKKLFETIHNHIYVRKNKKAAFTLVATLFPNEERIRKALRDDLAPEILQKIFEYHKELRSFLREATINELAGREQTVVKAHSATTEEIARYEQGSVVYSEFPGGTRRLAEQILRPGMTFHEVEFLEPGKDAGVKYHLLYWDGKQWTMLGPLWRTLK